ncbi:hypothetical protein PIB30_076881 [Stylosanthes scabra]|uniref:Uncharacterized protein n=1 Tax=Stylosanthes scabra TaxID=79078 RepID=A0ABU6QRM6_9FABA|nr:hypothetical protein [Stylosanthes scabra]
MSDTFKNKVVHSKQIHQVWSKIEEYFTAATSARIQSLKTQLKFVKKTSIGYDVRDDDHIHVIMDGLPNEYTVYTTSIIIQMGSLRVPEAESSLIAFDEMAEKRKSTQSTMAIANLVQNVNFNRGAPRGRGRVEGTIEEEDDSTSTIQDLNAKSVAGRAMLFGIATIDLMLISILIKETPTNN